MALTREQLIEIAVEKFFKGMNAKNVDVATSIMAENCLMRFSAAKYRYENRAANIVHLTEVTETFSKIYFHNFVNVVDVPQQAIATRFNVELTKNDGEVVAMSNSNWFQMNAEGLVSEIIIYNAAPLKEGFEAGSAT